MFRLAWQPSAWCWRSVGVWFSPSALAADAAPPERVSRSHDRPLAQPEGTQRFLLSTPLRDTAYLVQVFVPSGPAPKDGWPVLYAMDGKAIFDVLATQADAAPPKSEHSRRRRQL
ncbi:MAG: hypothetical protein JHC61_02735 [Burkholderiaceae bacterium]|nr:hypothetical protein [Burkholderiaceae bacterium]